MAVYRVWAKAETDVYIDIEAESAEKARELAEDIDGGAFHEDGLGDWVFGQTCKIENSDPDYTQEELEGRK